jgi:radical SAM superfamily enzyme YgiQ (UPF0313 family)
MPSSIVFISPNKTSATCEDGTPVQKLRTNMSLPGMMILGSLDAMGSDTHFIDTTTEHWNCQRMVGRHLLAYGLSARDTVERLAGLRATHVLITSMFSFEYMMVDELVREIKESLPGTIVILGGIHAGAKAEWHFQESNPDFIIIGEGEQTVVDLLIELSRPECDPRRVPGIAYRDSTGQIVRTSERARLCELDRPWAVDEILRRPDGSLRYTESMSRKSPVYVDDVVGESIPAAALFGSRGCPRGCRYCTSTHRTGRQVRHIGAYRLFAYFLRLRQQYGVGAFANQADTFGVHPNDIEFLKMVREYRAVSRDTSFVINNPNAFFLEQLFVGSDNVEVNREFLELLKDAGFNIITVAIETLTQRFNAKIDWKRIRPEMVVELSQTIRDMGFTSDFYMMYGFPGQTKEEFERDVAFAHEIRQSADLVTWNSLSLLPGTQYYEEYVEKPGKEDTYREIVRDGYGCYFARDEFNLSKVSAEYFRNALVDFGKSWV